jgi:hypothetical protein
MSSTDLWKIGSVSLLDVDIINSRFGHDFLPYPFMLTQPSRFSWHDEYDQYEEYERSIPERYNNGDLAIFQPFAVAYGAADIRVECHVQYIPSDTSSVRVLALRSDQLGFLAQQRPDEDVIDIYELSPYLLGPAVADSVTLEKPGRQPAIVIPEYVRSSNNAGTSTDLTIRHTPEDVPDAIKVPRAEVTAFGTVQTHWRPTRRWGIDRSKEFAVWVRIKDDGEYLYKPDFSEATPVTQPILAERIDQLISEDVKALRQFRSG